MTYNRIRRKFANRRRGPKKLGAEALERREMLAVLLFDATAQVTAIDDPLGLLQGAVPVGAIFSGQFTYDSDLAEDDVTNGVDANPNIGQFQGGDPNTVVSGHYGPLGFRSLTAAVFSDPVNVGVIDGQPSDPKDQFFLEGEGDTTPPILGQQGINFLRVQVNLVDNEGTVFSGDSLPTDLPLDQFETRNVTLIGTHLGSGLGDPDSDVFSVTANLTSLVKSGGGGGASDNEKLFQNIFQDLLARLPSASELQALVNALPAGRALVIQGLLQQNEYLTKQVESFYQELLKRAPDADGSAFWVGRLANGVAPEQVLAAIGGSPEYFEQRSSDNQQFVQQLYQDLLGRTGDQAGVDFWLGTLQQGGTRERIVLGFANSKELIGLLVDDPNDVLGALGGWYQQYLQRNADDAGRDYWTNQVGDVWAKTQAAILATDEYFGKLAPA